jgi:hypothetical protein
MAKSRKSKAVYSNRYRQPSLLNTLLFRLEQLSPFNSKEFPMPTSRRNIIIRTVATLCGDVATGVAMASAALWIIQAATLGLFLSFLLWLLSAILALAFSQYVVHPAASVLLSDRKLDMGIKAVSAMATEVAQMGQLVMGRFKPVV